MKKRTYLVAQVDYFANDAIASIQIPTNEAEAVAAQAEERKDLRFHLTGDDVESLVVIPWEKVASVMGIYRIADVAAPTDTICGGEAVNPLVLTPKALSDIGEDVYYVNIGDCMLIFPGLSVAIQSVSYNGEEIPSDDWEAFDITINGAKPDSYYESAQTPHECGDTSIVAGEKYPVTYTVSYNGATGSVTIDIPITVGA